ncbi:MAG: MarR family transcriptional regulator [Bacteroidetes bacterium]|nr:MarR family transcriptional regulator [Bacteroidota bacterium]
MKLEQAILSTKFKSDTHKAVLNILYSAWWLKTTMSKAIKEYSLTHEQYNVLRILKGKYPEQMCVRDIACRMIEKNSNVPRIIDRLEIKKLVKRTNSLLDKRETVISLTTSGIVMLEAATQSITEIMEGIIDLSATDAKELNVLLEKIRENEI